MGGADAVCGDNPGGEYHRLPEGSSGSESGLKEILCLLKRKKLWQWRHMHSVYVDNLCIDHWYLFSAVMH